MRLPYDWNMDEDGINIRVIARKLRELKILAWREGQGRELQKNLRSDIP